MIYFIILQQLMTRKDTPLQQGKSVFSQSGNTSNTANIVSVAPVTPVPTQTTLQGPNVRRSSRLFINSNSVKVSIILLVMVKNRLLLYL